jgi:hypothetical protein
MKPTPFAIGLILVVMTTPVAIGAHDAVTVPPDERDTADFFETRVRPVLLASCLECHGEEKQESDVRLDSLAGLLRGNGDGPVLVPGEPETSRLIRAIRYSGEIKMPPAARLPQEEIDALTRWVSLGAPWPDSRALLSRESSSQGHWAFQPVREPPLPAVEDSEWVRMPVDRFILSRLEAVGMHPGPAADRRTLLRRLSLDLIGLPPTPEEVASFADNLAPGAVEEAVERLLDSPHFGERWARYWLDIARYSDTKGYVFTQDRSYKYAYVFRDWVIRSLNEDLPFDKFLMYQLAADQMLAEGQREPLAAMGFLTVGRRFLNNQSDIIDDRIDVVTRGMMGLTVACARCHDHKYDPIPTADYYSLYGVFSASQENTLPLEEPTLEYQEELQQRERAAQDYLARKIQELRADSLQRPGVYLAAAFEGKYAAREAGYWKKDALREPSSQLLERWGKYLDAAVKPDSPIFRPWHQLAELPAAEFANRAAELCRQYAANGGEPRLNPHVARLFENFEPASFDPVIDRYGQLLAQVHERWEAQLAQATARQQPAPTRCEDPADEELRLVLYGSDSPATIPSEEAERQLSRTDREQLRKLRDKVTEWTNSDKGPRQAQALEDRSGRQRNPRILVRGNPRNQGAEVPRQFLQLLAGPDRRPFEHGSGRLELARAIAAPDNPLTARVWVNRVWEHLFGQGLVGTPSDFGLRSDPPSHPALLDYLAARFVAEGWSTKWLVRQIVLSATYQQSSAYRADAAAVDPENRLLWRMNRRRLDFEGLRDSLLAVSGALDRTVHGTSVDINRSPFSARRTVYAYIDRQNLPGVFRTFDFASPDTHSPRRFNTTVPQQALYLMNHPFAVEQARHLLARPDVQERADAADRMARLYEILFARLPHGIELAMGGQYVRDVPTSAGDKVEPWVGYAQALLMSNEFLFID